MKRQDGFTLVEVAMVVLIGGILLASASALLLTYFKKTQIGVTEKRLEAVDEALQLFLNLNGRYPCPADPSLLPDTANFGREQYAAPNCVTTPTANGRGARSIRIGTVPVRTLGLPDDFSVDAWSGKFTYAVTEALAEENTYNRNEGGIFVVDSAGNQIAIAPPVPPAVTPTVGVAHYVIISHGPDGAGATPLSGTAATPCNAGALDGENCNGDATFRSTLNASTANNASHFDDHISIRSVTAFGEQVPEGAVMAFNLSACPQGWVNFTSANGRMVIGADGTYASGSTGGAERVGLSKEESGYPLSTDAIAAGSLVPVGTAGSKLYYGEWLGTNAPDHENMAPYIALLYCEKS